VAAVALPAAVLESDRDGAQILAIWESIPRLQECDRASTRSGSATPSDPSTDMIGRLHRTADMVDASRRILVCRIRRSIENAKLLVTVLAGWLRRLLA
jgi:hypothetical protein